MKSSPSSRIAARSGTLVHGQRDVYFLLETGQE